MAKMYRVNFGLHTDWYVEADNISEAQIKAKINAACNILNGIFSLDVYEPENGMNHPTKSDEEEETSF